MITKHELLSRLKATQNIDGEDLHITLKELYRLFPSYNREELISTILDMDDIKMTDSDKGGITIPKEYFDGQMPA